jgi:predicted transposase YdaD
MTGAERLREEGREQGRAEGRVEGRAAIILKQLALRFAPLSAATIARVRAASPDELDRIAERILSAKTLDELFS